MGYVMQLDMQLCQKKKINLTWLFADRLLGSPDSFPHEHLTV